MDYFLTKYKHFHKGTKKMKSRKIKAVLSLVLTIALLAGNIGLLVPKLTAEAATAGYDWKVVVKTTDDADSRGSGQTSYFRLNFLDQNGTGTSTSTVDVFTTEDWHYKTGTVSNSGTSGTGQFPTSIYIELEFAWTGA